MPPAYQTVVSRAQLALVNILVAFGYTVELEWLEYFWNHKNMFETEID